MEFRHSKKLKTVGTSSEYPHVLQLYLKPPTGDISLEEFEGIAFDRLKVLRILEQASLMGHKIYSQEWKAAILGYLKKDGLRKYANLLQNTGSNCDTDVDVSIRREDHISHFILRLCYCRSKDLRDWYVQRECELFRLRFSSLNAVGLKQFITAENLSYVPISEEAKNDVKEGLVQSTFGLFHADIEHRDFYKVHFEEVADLVTKRMVYLKAGYAYISSAELVSCLLQVFRSNLNQELTNAYRKLPFIEDERITGLIHSVHHMSSGKDYTVPENRNEIEVSDLQYLSEKSFPLCMRNLYDTIKATHHMKHFGRLQFGLFLKGIGLPLEEAIQYWKGQFTKLMDEDKFNKNYLYNIKHSYGLIGKMTNYTPYSCMKIISSSVGGGECHGCPYKHWELDNLKKKLYNYGVNVEGIKDITETVKNGHFQIACSKYFIHTHGGIESKALIAHPNQYFDESQEIINNYSAVKYIKKMSQNKTNKKIKCDDCDLDPCVCNTTQNCDKTNNMFDEDFNPGDMNWENIDEGDEDMLNTKEENEQV